MKKLLMLFLMVLFSSLSAQDVLFDLELDQKKVDALDAWKRKPFKVIEADGKKCIYLKGKGGISVPVDFSKYIGKKFTIFATIKYKDVPQTKKNWNGFKIAFLAKAGDGSYSGTQALDLGTSNWRTVKKTAAPIKPGTGKGYVHIGTLGGEIWISELFIESE